MERNYEGKMIICVWKRIREVEEKMKSVKIGEMLKFCLTFREREKEKEKEREKN